MTGLMAMAAVASACGGSSRPSRSVGPGTSVSSPVTVTVPAADPTTTSTTAAPTTTTTPPRPAPVPTPVTRPRATPATTAAGSQAVHATACRSNLANTLSHTGSASQLITVESSGYPNTVANLETWERSGGCWQRVDGPWTARIGDNGFSDHHVEGDSTSPTGAYGIGPVMYGNAPDPGVKEPYHRLVCGDWWDEDPRSPDYNTFQHVRCGTTPPFGGGSEALWTEPRPYPSFAVVDYNTDPARPYDGSAIFLQADTGSSTDGSVSLPVGELDEVLRWIDPAARPLIVMGPVQEISQF
ncbi:MAG TPA: hypothetical protein VFN68_01655 [Acidimicrobiales bacterium]|nr:hypothetical protein [Acidimicrobiales bacterium]